MTNRSISAKYLPSGCLLLRQIIGKHTADNGMPQMIIRVITGQISIEMLEGMIDMIFGGDLCIVPVAKGFAIFLCAIPGNLGGSKYCRRGK